MDELLEILNDINPLVDYSKETRLIDDKLLDSLEILTLVTQICDTFDISIGPKWMSEENFNSAEAMWAMIQTIQEEE